MTVRAIHNNYQFEPLDLQKIMAINSYFTWVGIITPFLLGTCHACLASTNFGTVD